MISTTQRMHGSVLGAAFSDLTKPGGPFPITTAEVGGATIQVFDRAPRTLVDAFEATEEFGELESLVYQDERYTFADQYKSTHAIAHELVDRFGIRPGDRVAIAMRNYPEWPLFFWAAQLTGAVVVPLNAWLSGPELAAIIENSEPAVLIADGDRWDRLATDTYVLNSLRGAVTVRSTRSGAVAATDLLEGTAARQGLLVPAHRPLPDDPATILYTSGTMGRPKGVLGTHRNHISTILSIHLRAAAMQQLRSESQTPSPPVDLPKSTLLSFPLFHIAGLSIMTSAALGGRRLVLMHKWNAEEAIRLIAQEQVTDLTGPPLIVRQTVAAARETDLDVSSLVTLGNGGGPATKRQVQEVIETFGGRVIPTTGYGLTETTSAVLLNVGEDFLARPAGIGWPLPTVQVRVCDEAGNDVSQGEPGELWIKGPQVAAGYLGRSAINDTAFSNGWFRTGDLVTQGKDGSFELVGRLKDIVIRGGENIQCAEVESKLEEHPDVLEAAVIGQAHPLLGETVAAVVRLRPGHSVTKDGLTKFARTHLASFKVPDDIRIVVDPLPRNAAGKLIKDQLKVDTQPTTGGATNPLSKPNHTDGE